MTLRSLGVAGGWSACAPGTSSKPPPYPPPQVGRPIAYEHRERFFSPPPCGEGSGVGVDELGHGRASLADPPPRPSPTRGEGAGRFWPHAIALRAGAGRNIAISRRGASIFGGRFRPIAPRAAAA